MKRDSLTEGIFTLLSGILYGSMIPFAALAALVTAFSLHLPPVGGSLFTPLELEDLLWHCIAFSLLFSLCFTVKKLWPAAPIFLLLYLSYAWLYRNGKKELFDLLYIISRRYDNAYGCGVIRYIGDRPHYADLTMVLRYFAAMGTAIVTWAACKRQSSYWVLLFSLLCFVPCCIITNTVPANWCLFLWGLFLILFLMTGHVRRSSSYRSILLTLFFAVPIAIALNLLFLFVPSEGYTGKEQADAILDTLQNGFHISDALSGVGDTYRADSVNLTALGKRQEKRIPVMYVTAPETGAYYLRGQVYSIYTGRSWEADTSFSELPWLQTAPTGQTISIRTRFEHEMLYVPYSTDSLLLYATGPMMSNSQGLKEYQFDHYAKRGHTSIYSVSPIPSYWIALPESTRSWAEPFVDDILSSHVRDSSVAKSIAAYVRASATYSLQPDRMDSSYEDFAQWFITEGEEGYCVHFAATAAVLLRAAGIPARYVSGYMVEVTAGQETTVYQKNGHAWVEYWDPYYGWQVLEATPSGQQTSADTSEADPTTQSEETTEPTTVTTGPTEPEEATTSTASQTSEDAGIIPDGPSSAPLSSSRTITKWLVLSIVALLILLGQRRLRLYLWQRAYGSSTVKGKALKAWSRASSYAKLLKEAPDASLRSIAEKAKFSQHPITPTELEAFQAYFRAAQDKLNSHPLHRRIYARWILALY